MHERSPTGGDRESVAEEKIYDNFCCLYESNRDYPVWVTQLICESVELGM